MRTHAHRMAPWPDLETHARRVTLPTSGVSLFVYDTGPADGMPLILIHGLGNEADTWRYVIPPLAERFRVVAPDLPGFGRSDKPRRAYTVPFFRDALLELLDVLAIRRAQLVGHSLGAIIAHFAALTHPDRVERLVLVAGGLLAPSQKLDAATLLFLIPGVGELLYRRFQRNPDAAYRSLEPYYSRLDDLPEPERAFLYRRVNERVRDEAQRRAFFSAFRRLALWLPSQQRGLQEALARLTVPTLVIWGEADRVNSVANGQALAAVQPSARLVIVPGAGHNVQEEAPRAVAQAILE
ncbi:MAG: alpha/beta fold hydrolase [Chloroflexi bacterium]|nr:alpha/beta fold hydrolase [Chloroflexota bacterium]